MNYRLSFFYMYLYIIYIDIYKMLTNKRVWHIKSNVTLSFLQFFKTDVSNVYTHTHSLTANTSYKNDCL
jgi:hypothetical protein